MKHLKIFELYESSDNQEHIQFINDICLDISDLGFTVIIDEVKNRFSNDSIRVSISGEKLMYQYKPFTYDDISDVFERIIEYMKGEGFEISYIFYSEPNDPSSHNSLNYVNGKLVTYIGSKKEIERFHHVEIRFTEE